MFFLQQGWEIIRKYILLYTKNYRITSKPSNRLPAIYPSTTTNILYGFIYVDDGERNNNKKRGYLFEQKGDNPAEST